MISIRPEGTPKFFHAFIISFFHSPRQIPICSAVGGGVLDAPNVPVFHTCGPSPKGLASLRRTPAPTESSPQTPIC